ncbi:MAG: nadD [Gemmatimonadetes bacterium]|nr:nadD [Gemmatimonadota bacterium]
MRIGVFGGTFDPPHVGHLIAAADAHRALGLDRLLFVPSAVPPHKRSTVRASARLRLEMVRAAIAGDGRFAADDLELRRSGPSYSVDTLRALKEREPAGELFFLIGADNLRELPGWHRPHEIVRLATLVVLSREGEGPGGGAGPFPARHVAVTRVDVSATDVRARAARGEPIRYLVPEAVRAVVEREGLYRGPSTCE